MTGHEVHPPDPDTVRVNRKKHETRPGAGAPGEDATRERVGRQGEAGAAAGTGGSLGDEATESGIDELPARRLHGDGTVREEE